MDEKEYKECQFIYYEMRFTTYEEFLKDAFIIKRMYRNLTNKLFYRWYIYAHKISWERKESMWAFLNDDITYDELKLR